MRFESRASTGSIVTAAALERLTRGLENRSMLEERARSRSSVSRGRSQNGSQLRGTNLDADGRGSETSRPGGFLVL
ncbi:hypothetical protein ACHHYP_20151 [Achlya hypogyna]|uniref:Uncharacterized protein n=1 Tax=Achlya hypogyna TaxID=1202772 RepID=A0A1V9Z2V5_ACHHY|nr:hypothetical protein ACHHYP_20151 [Achlya hypogyna]